MAKRSRRISKLEHSLLLRQSSDGTLRQVLFSYLEGGAALKRLRLCSRVLRDVVSWHLFQRLSVSSQVVTCGKAQYLEGLAPYCRHLTIRINSTPQLETDMASGPSPIGSPVARQATIEATSNTQTPGQTRASKSEGHYQRLLWYSFLLPFYFLESFTLQVDNEPPWPGSPQVGDLLIAIRVALQHANPEHLRVFALHPINAMGVVHLRWSGLGACGSTPAARPFWEKLHTLRISMLSPFGPNQMSSSQSAMFKKILYDYLRSLAPTLRALQFVWLGGPGPSPVALHLEPELQGGNGGGAPLHESGALGISLPEPRQAIIWPRLEQLWLGNVARAEHNGALERTVASRLKHFYVLSPMRMSPTVRTESIESLVWVDIMTPEGMERLAEESRHWQI